MKKSKGKWKEGRKETMKSGTIRDKERKKNEKGKEGRRDKSGCIYRKRTK